MLKLYKVEAEEWNWDQYDSIVVLAENEEDAIEIGKGWFDGEDALNPQGEITAELVDMTKRGVILSSYNAG